MTRRAGILGSTASIVLATTVLVIGCGPSDDEEPTQSQLLSRAGCLSAVCRHAADAKCWPEDSLDDACRSCENTIRNAFAFSLWTACSTEFHAYRACLEKTEFYCASPGSAAPVGCDTSKADLERCLSPLRDAGSD